MSAVQLPTVLNYTLYGQQHFPKPLPRVINIAL
jgi:hypothetical protein